MKKPKKIPKFKNEHEEREFWVKNDATEYFDASKVERVRPGYGSILFRPSTKTPSSRW